MNEISKSREESNEQVKENMVNAYLNTIVDDISNMYDAAYQNGYTDGYFTYFVEFAEEVKKDFEKSKFDKDLNSQDEYVKGYVDALMNMSSKGYKMAHECSTCKYYKHLEFAGRTMNSYACSLVHTINVCASDFCSKWVKRK